VVGGAFAGSANILGFDGWRWVFFINLPIGLAALAVVFLYLHLPAKHVKQKIDYWGAAAITLAIVPLLLVAEQGRSWGWASAELLPLLRPGRPRHRLPSCWPRSAAPVTTR
jgi:hypothetical protein